MDCKKATKVIPAFIKDELSVKETELLLMHMEQCPECKEELTIQLLVSEGLLSLEEGKEFDLNREIKNKIFQAKRRIKWHKKIKLAGLFAGFVLMFALIVVACLIFL